MPPPHGILRGHEGNRMKVTIDPGESVTVEVRGYGMLYTVETEPVNDFGEMDVMVVDHANDYVIDDNTLSKG